MSNKIGMVIILCALAAGASAEWYDNIKLKGDVRLREEFIDQDGKEDCHTDRRFMINNGLQVPDPPCLESGTTNSWGVSCRPTCGRIESLPWTHPAKAPTFCNRPKRRV